MEIKYLRTKKIANQAINLIITPFILAECDAYMLKFKEIKQLTIKKLKKNLILRAFFWYFWSVKTVNCKIKKLSNVE